jgi:DNA-directed RNA polymerase specialized sigma24 family protein
MPDRTGMPPNPTTFGASSSAQQREAQRQERDREAQNALNELTEEQREEINEAV